MRRNALRQFVPITGKSFSFGLPLMRQRLLFLVDSQKNIRSRSDSSSISEPTAIDLLIKSMEVSSDREPPSSQFGPEHTWPPLLPFIKTWSCLPQTLIAFARTLCPFILLLSLSYQLRIKERGHWRRKGKKCGVAGGSGGRRGGVGWVTCAEWPHLFLWPLRISKQ